MIETTLEADFVELVDGLLVGLSNDGVVLTDHLAEVISETTGKQFAAHVRGLIGEWLIARKLVDDAAASLPSISESKE